MRLGIFLVLATLLLACIAKQRAPEYDEAYSIFLTAGDAHPAWPAGVFTAASVRGFYAPHASLRRISRDLKVFDVHPPLYFWALEGWRRCFGPGWFTARLLSVLFSVAALAVLGAIARAAGVPVIPALALTLLSYGFAYTGTVARGFALAQLFNLVGFYIVLQAQREPRQARALLAGLAFGTASFTNYLAVFTAGAVFFWLCLRAPRRLPPGLALGLLPFLALDFSYFRVQRDARVGQFVAFSPFHALAELARDSGAAVFGGLPVYAAPHGMLVALALALLALACLACALAHQSPYRLLLALAVTATPCGLLALGLVFGNTPIEIRYLAFSLPYLALLLAAALPRWLLWPMLAVQVCGIFGLIFAHATMQPQGLAAAQASALAQPGAVILVPFGNDGVGIPGPFIAALPGAARVELLHAGQVPDFTGVHEIILAKIAVDAASRTATTQALKTFEAPGCFTLGKSTPLAVRVHNHCVTP